MKNLLILGAGGHGRVVAETAELEGRWDKIAFLDDREDIKQIYNFDIIGKIEEMYKFANEYKYAFVAIGNNEKRIELISKLMNFGFMVPSIISPKSFVSKYSSIGEGTVILPGAVVNTGTSLGKGCIVNVNVCVDHDCEIEDGVHISSGAVVRSMCTIGRLAFIGAGSLVSEGSRVKELSRVEDGSAF